MVTMMMVVMMMKFPDNDDDDGWTIFGIAIVISKCWE